MVRAPGHQMPPLQNDVAKLFCYSDYSILPPILAKVISLVSPSFLLLKHFGTEIMASIFWDKITSKVKRKRDGEHEGAAASPIRPTTPSKSIAETSASGGDALQPAQTTHILTSTQPEPYKQATPSTAHHASSVQQRGMDFNALRVQALLSGTDGEAVTVNTRALIDKVLARYSSEW
jgi:hypothetical protein